MKHESICLLNSATTCQRSLSTKSSSANHPSQCLPFSERRLPRANSAFKFAMALGITMASFSAVADMCQPVGGSHIIYVDQKATGNDDGSSWSNAFQDLHDALHAASLSAGADQIWLAKGQYATGDNPGKAYMFDSDIAVFGGFTATEHKLEQRKPKTNLTILDGAMAAHHVIYANGLLGVSIDGITVTGGNATGNTNVDTHDITNEVRGGGLLAFNSTIALCNVKFIGNKAKKFGGAIYHEGGSLSIQKSSFRNNTVLRGEFEVHDDFAEADTDGGAVAVHDAELKIVKSTFSDNVAGDDGAALAARRANVKISESRFLRNKGIGFTLPAVLPVFTDDFITSMGGAISIQNEATSGSDQSKTILIKNSKFIENQSAIGSAAFILGAPGSETMIQGNTFVRNGGNGKANPTAPANEQGVAFGKGAAAMLLVGLRGADREVNAEGDLVRTLHKATIKDSLFKNNEAGYGGAMVLIALNADVKNSTFENNVGRQRAGAIWSQNFLALFDQIFGLIPDLGTVHVDKSTFRGNRTLGILETLQADSFPGIAINAEQTFGGGAISNDQAGNLIVSNSRFIDNASINSDGGAIHNATSPVSFFGTLQPPAPSSYGGTLSVNNSTFINNQTLGSGSGGAIANGGNQVNGQIADAQGNNVRDTAESAIATIKNSTFLDNRAEDEGGAIVNWNGSVIRVGNSEFENNTARNNGGAIATLGHELNNAHIEVIRNEIEENSAGGAGGGIYAIDTTGKVSYSEISDNTPDNIIDVTGALEIRNKKDE